VYVFKNVEAIINPQMVEKTFKAQMLLMAIIHDYGFDPQKTTSEWLLLMDGGAQVSEDGGLIGPLYMNQPTANFIEYHDK